jgi:hypothetical protein
MQTPIPIDSTICPVFVMLVRVGSFASLGRIFPIIIFRIERGIHHITILPHIALRKENAIGAFVQGERNMALSMPRKTRLLLQPL